MSLYFLNVRDGKIILFSQKKKVNDKQGLKNLINLI